MSNLPWKKIILSSSFLLLIVGLLATLYLVQQRQLFAPGAANPPIQFKTTGNGTLPQEEGVPVTDKDTIKIYLEAPTAPK